jgi:4-hydroxythreonine-4-phosphate dehydrogenase
MSQTTKKDKTLIALTMGDPNGIGHEIILKGYSEFKKKPYGIIVIGNYRFLREKAQTMGLSMNFHLVDDSSELKLSPNILNVMDLDVLPEGVSLGTPTKEAGQASYEFIKKATSLAMEGKVSAITTAPINKKALSLAGLNYAGHTEILAKLTGSQNYAMMLMGGNIKVVLVSIHIALSEVKKFIKKERICKIITLANGSLKKFGIKTPHIAVAGLNPHAGDGGIFGKEETEEILPAIEMARQHNIDVTGPHPADALFVKAKKGDFDAVVVMYHDQGLIPVKMEAFGKGVNVTLGLPIIRTSVDHGTAYDIVGKGVSSPSSLIEALDVAAELATTINKESDHCGILKY